MAQAVGGHSTCAGVILAVGAAGGGSGLHPSEVAGAAGDRGADADAAAVADGDEGPHAARLADSSTRTAGIPSAGGAGGASGLDHLGDRPAHSYRRIGGRAGMQSLQ